ncbi:hypothetical protein [Nocardia thailandica]|uniref:hypothetical protein n=1 Tax=Nocardia thailandica TaxID=257275 RepID=UPI0002F7E7EE|nr:hypothetical protein [Nocardia thailandica]
MDNPATIGHFACEFGDRELAPQDIADFDTLWSRCSETPFATMGALTLRTMSRPVLDYIIPCIRATADSAGIEPGAVDHVVFATSDSQLTDLPHHFARTVLGESGMSTAVPALLGLQQCCTSIAALDYAHRLVTEGTSTTTMVVTFDYTTEDADRVQPFAVFGDAVATCLVSSASPGGFVLTSTAIGTDAAGLRGEDSFGSRRRVAARVLDRVLDGRDVEAIFPTNLYAPMVLFNAVSAGLDRSRLHFAQTLRNYGHCGNCDWMINLVDYAGGHPFQQGSNYLIQSSAPGFYAAGLLHGI